MGKIKCHFLSPLKSKSTPKRIIFFDTESYIVKKGDITELPFRLAWTCYINRVNRKIGNVEDWVFHDNKESVCDYIISKTYKKTCLWVFAHNVYHDLRVIDFFTYAEKNKWSVELYVDQGKTSILKVKKQKASIIFLSTTNYFRFSLKALGKAIGIEKMEVDFLKATENQLKDYCRNDTEIVKISVMNLISYIEDKKMGSFGLSSPSQAMNCYRHSFYRRKIFPHDSKTIEKIERESYFGGRVEAFHLGDISKHKVVVYDVNSMYPYVMKSNLFPTYAYRHYKKVTINQLKKLLKDYLVVARVYLNCVSPLYPLRRDNRTVFPVGYFNTTLSTPELKAAIQRNNIINVYDCICYYKGMIFRDYVDFFYKEKLSFSNEGNKIYRTLVKLFLNSLYGKFGQRGYDQLTSIDFSHIDPYRERVIDFHTGEIYWKTRFINTEIKDYVSDKPRHTFVSIAAHVTAYARLYLWKMICCAGRENVFYCDTDSLFTNHIGAERLSEYIDNTQLGKLSIQKTPKTIKINGLKDYEIDGLLTAKGIKKDATKISDNEWFQKQFESLKSAIKNRRLSLVIAKRVKKELSREYKKGIVQKDGKIIPFSLNDPDCWK